MTLEERRRLLLPNFKAAMERMRRGDISAAMANDYLNSLLWSAREGVSERQLVISFTKWMHDFNVDDITKDLQYLQGEVDEAKEAWSAEDADALLFELADVAIYCYGIAQMLGYDLDSAIKQKMDTNIERNYTY